MPPGLPFPKTAACLGFPFPPPECWACPPAQQDPGSPWGSSALLGDPSCPQTWPMSPGKGTLWVTQCLAPFWVCARGNIAAVPVWSVAGRGRVQQGPPAGAGHCPPWPGPAPAPAGSGGLVLRLDRKTNEFHYGIAILFHVSGSLRLTCSPGCDRPRHPRAALQRGAPHTCRARSCRGPAVPTLIPAGALQHLGGGKDQGQGSGTATVLSHVPKVLRPPKDSSRRQARAKHDPSRALGGHVLPKHRLGGREGVGHGGLGTLTTADGTGDLTRPMGCS